MMLRRIIALVAGLAVVGLVAALGLAIAAQGQAGRPLEVEDSKAIGKPAPDFAITTFGGEPLTLSQFRGRVVVVNFWASLCPPCRAEAPTLESMWQAYRDRDVVFIGVDIEDTEAEARAFLQQFNITYPNGADTKGRITRDYKVTNLPTSIFVSRKGTIAQRWVGAIDRARLTQYLDGMLAP